MKKGSCAAMSKHGGGHSFVEVTGRKDVKNGGCSSLKNDPWFWTLFVTFQRQIQFFLLFTTDLPYFNNFEHHIKYDS